MQFIVYRPRRLFGLTFKIFKWFKFGLSNNWTINYATTGKKEEFDETKAVHLSVVY